MGMLTRYGNQLTLREFIHVTGIHSRLVVLESMPDNWLGERISPGAPRGPDGCIVPPLKKTQRVLIPVA